MLSSYIDIRIYSFLKKKKTHGKILLSNYFAGAGDLMKSLDIHFQPVHALQK